MTFTVYGRPQPQGSTRAFIPKGWKRPVITTDNKNLKSWRQQVSVVAVEAVGGHMKKRPDAVQLSVRFYFSRPKSLAKKITWNSKKPDCDKLARSVADSLTGIAYEDDSQIHVLHVEKLYGSPERTEIEVL